MGKCKNCDYWKPTENNYGLCKCHAPMATIVAATGKVKYQICWPSTGSEDECGEYIGKSNA